MFFLVLFLIALLLSSIGFKKFVWFISIGYGLSIAGIGLGLLIHYYNQLTLITTIMSMAFIIYGIRLGGYLLIRELKSKAYQSTMKNEINDGSSLTIWMLIMIWISASLLYVLETSPVYFRMMHHSLDDTWGYIGMIIMILGIVLEASADYVKNKYKQNHPKRFCDVSLFKIVRCPNYLGEVLTWSGVFISGISIYSNIIEWILAILGWLSIVYIMFGGARRLEMRQNKNYGNDKEYQEYVKKVPILIPFIPLYSVEKYKWLKG